MRWHTTGDIKNGAFSKWADDLAQAFVRLEPQALNDQEFKGEIAKVNTDEIQLSRVTATGHRVRRLKEHIDLSSSDICFINIQIGGIGELAPSRRSDLAKLGFKALIAGTLASYLSATLAGLLL